MSILSWFFGRSNSRKGRPPTIQWSMSDSGNATVLQGDKRITVFRKNDVWKYCIADKDDRQEPFFSEAYANEHEAQQEALAHFRGEPSRYRSLSTSFEEDRRKRWEVLIGERSQLIEDLKHHLSRNPDLGITALRKPEAKIASHLKQLDWQIGEYQRAGVSSKLVSVAQQQKTELAKLAEEVDVRIRAKQAIRPPRKAPISKSQLSPDLASKVDNLIRLFSDSPTMEDDEREQLYRKAIRSATAKMLEEGINYGLASGAPEFMNQDEESFRAFMKKVDKDLEWQTETVATAFRKYMETGEIPAPHYPMRIAILLRKAKDFDREREFLAAWCRHFPSGNGAKYVALVERAKKCSAI